MNADEITRRSLEICEEYADDGLDLTVRQLYYQFVSRGWVDSGDDVYQAVVRALTRARLSGRFPMRYIVDRGRKPTAGDCTIDSTSALAVEHLAKRYVGSVPRWILNRARWLGQRNHVSVWFEKEALSGVFADTCDELGVGTFACKGYPSVSALWQWLERTTRACTEDYWKDASGLQHRGRRRASVILYLGDHDPDGWEIPRSAERNLNQLQAVSATRWAGEQAEEYGWRRPDEDSTPDEVKEWADEVRAREEDFPEYVPIVVKRIALNMDQIDRYDPPPFAAKKTSSRYKRYKAEHDTERAWELDALEPRVLQALVEDHVRELFDDEVHERNSEVVATAREELVEMMEAPGWIRRAL